VNASVADVDVSASGGRAADLEGQVAWPLFQAGLDMVGSRRKFQPFSTNTEATPPFEAAAQLGSDRRIA
jgi:hypothetical protein